MEIPEKHLKGANKRRIIVYEETMALLEENDVINQQTLVEHLNEKYPRKEWNTKQVGRFLIPLVSSMLIHRKRKRVLGMMATYYSLQTFNTKGTATEQHGVES